jgi:Universal stress protein family
VSETFPTKVLPAADGSKEAQQAPSTAADLTKSTGSELHVVHVGPFCPCLFPLWRKRRRGWRGRLVGRWTTRYRAYRGCRWEGRGGAPMGGRCARRDRRPGRGPARWVGGDGQQGQGRDKKSLDGKRFKFGGPLHLLPRPHSAQRRHDRLRGYRAREELVRR